MKPIEYVKKYKLSESDNFNHNSFISDLTIDFGSLLEVGNATQNFKGYENAVRAIKMKWDGINNKTLGQLPDKLWGYFYATVIAKTKEELFSDILNAQRKEKAERKSAYEERKKWEDSENERFFSWFFGSVKIDNTPIGEFKTLSLESDASEQDIKDRYRTLSKQHHPDKGGSQKVFIEITEAKNKCLAWAKK